MHGALFPLTHGPSTDKRSMKKLRLGLLGTGAAPRLLYMPAFRKLGRRIELFACSSRTRKNAEAFARLAGIGRVARTAEELFELPGLDAVLISLPIAVQPSFVLEALGRGLPVLSEKPIAPSVSAGKRLVRSAQQFRVPWLVGENYAFMDHVRKLEAWCRAGKLGDVRLVQGVQMTIMDRTNPFFGMKWRSQPEHVGGYVVDAGVHLAEVIRRCFGMPTRVKGLTASFDRALKPLDTAVASFELEGGALGTWSSCFCARYQGPMLRAYGSRANAELGSREAVLEDHRGRRTVFRSRRDSFVAQFEHFADMVQKGTAPQITPDEALSDLVFAQRILEGR